MICSVKCKHYTQRKVSDICKSQYFCFQFMCLMMIIVFMSRVVYCCICLYSCNTTQIIGWFLLNILVNFRQNEAFTFFLNWLKMTHFMWRPVCVSACPEHGLLNVCQGKNVLNKSGREDWNTHIRSSAFYFCLSYDYEDKQKLWYVYMSKLM